MDEFVDGTPARIEVAEEAKRLSHGQEILQCRLLELDSRFIPEARAERLTVIEDFTRSLLRDSFHHLDGRRLARAIRPEKSEALAFLDRE
jgi:hypothetical protein